MKSYQSNQSGFTMVELIAVIVLLGIISTASVQFIQSSVGIYQDTVRRSNLSHVGRFAVERVSRELATALPGSVRVSGSGGTQCLEFIPVVAASSYITLDTAVAVSSVDAAIFSPPTGSGWRVAVYPINPSEIYAPIVAGIQPLAAVDNFVVASPLVTINLTGSNQFPLSSPSQRLFIVGGAVSFCAQDGTLRRYSAYATGVVQSVPPGGNSSLLAEHIRLSDNGVGVTVFSFTPGALARAGIVHLNFRFMDDTENDEWIRFSQEVAIRNTP
jgi:MSHA biogenesis protein MshO